MSLRSSLRVALLCVAAATTTATAHAQSIDAQLFHPTATARGYFSVDGAYVLRHLGGSGGIYASYALNPLVARCRGYYLDGAGTPRGCAPEGAIPPRANLIGHQLAMEAVASFAVVDHLEFGVALPFVAYQKMDSRLPGVDGDRASAAALGDFRFDFKALLHAFKLAFDHQIALALIAGFSAPTGDATAYLSQGWTGRVRVVFEWKASKFASLALNVGALLRPSSQLADLYVGHQISYGLAGRVHIISGLEVLAEATGLIGVGLPSAVSLSSRDLPAEILAGLRYRAPFGLEISAAGGAGITRGYGAPDARVVLGIRYASPDRKPVEPPRKLLPGELDTDGDGILDARDRCPGLAGPISEEGCPEPDRDRDGVPDARDKCPDEVGVKQLAGCAELDSDRDGIVDRLDKCPVEEGLQELEGCPIPDGDGDGIPDSTDRCPKERGTRENQGCPDFDSDNDGYVDRHDQCPVEEEIWNGVDDDDGCPDAGKPLAVLLGDRIRLLAPIDFVGGTATISPKSHAVLGVVAALVNLHREIKALHIEGHVAIRASALDNLELSRTRAIAVRRYLQETRGVDPQRLIAQGFGRDRPLVPGKSLKVRAQNTRIELVIE